MQTAPPPFSGPVLPVSQPSRSPQTVLPALTNTMQLSSYTATVVTAALTVYDVTLVLFL